MNNVYVQLGNAYKSGKKNVIYTILKGMLLSNGV